MERWQQEPAVQAEADLHGQDWWVKTMRASVASQIDTVCVDHSANNVPRLQEAEVRRPASSPSSSSSAPTRPTSHRGASPIENPSVGMKFEAADLFAAAAECGTACWQGLWRKSKEFLERQVGQQVDPAQCSRCSDVRAASKELVREVRRLQGVDKELQTLQQELEEAKGAMKGHEQDVAALHHERTQLERSLELSISVRDAAAEQEEVLEQRILELKAERDEYEAATTVLSSEHAQLSGKVSDMVLELAGMKSKLKEVQANADAHAADLRTKADAHAAENSKLYANLQDLRTKADAHAAENSKLRANLQEMQATARQPQIVEQGTIRGPPGGDVDSIVVERDIYKAQVSELQEKMRVYVSEISILEAKLRRTLFTSPQEVAESPHEDGYQQQEN